MSQGVKVAIIGAGPSGLIAANILHAHGWPVTVIEADASATSRDQGGSLDLHPDSGQVALAKAGLLQRFLSIARYEDQETRIIDAVTGEVLRASAPTPGEGDRPEIDRIALRELLVQPLPKEVVVWGAKVRDIADAPGARYRVHLTDRTLGPFDLVIGADGAWSRVRALLSPVKPTYTGVTFLELWFHDVDKRHAALASLVGRGSLYSLHGDKGLFGQRNGGGTIRLYAAISTPRIATGRVDESFVGVSMADILGHFREWAPGVLALVKDADRIAAVRRIYTLPPDFGWTHRAGLTLVGDAAHVMPPMGSGVNLAMLDAAELAEALVSRGNLDAKVTAFETSMRDRAAPIAAETIAAFAAWFSAAGAQTLIDHMDAHEI